MRQIEVNNRFPAVLKKLELVETEPLLDTLLRLSTTHTAEKNLLLLAHADDGVIWGKVCLDDNTAEKIRLAPDSVPLNWTTLQTLRLFSQQSEFLLWREGVRWKARAIENCPADQSNWRDSYDEHHLLWGTRCVRTKDEFSTLEHGVEGLKHSVPLVNLKSDSKTGNLAKPVALHVRHYLSATGSARVVTSRLVNVVQL